MKLVHQVLCILALATTLSVFSEDNKTVPWTWLYYKTFNEQQQEQSKEKVTAYFERDTVPLFTQLVFSWNALRPKQGYFSFWVQVRDEKSKQWGSWHHMMDWGAQVQRSYMNEDTNAFTSYKYVRLEVEHGKMADAFRIRVTVHENARLEFLKAFSVSLSNFNNFKPEIIDTTLTLLPSVHVAQIPAISQFGVQHHKQDGICSPTSCSMLTSFLLQHYIDPAEFAEQSYDNGLNVYGSWPFNVAHAFELGKGAFFCFTTRLNSFMRVHQHLVDGIPVVVSVRGPLQGAASGYREGHLLVVVGWDAKKQQVVVHDPAFKQDHHVLHRYALKDFLEAWERSRRLAYWVEQTVS